MENKQVLTRLPGERFRGRMLGLALVVMSGMQGCATPFTYLSPQLNPGTNYPSATQIVKGEVEPFPGVEAYCDHTLRGATHQALAISIENNIGVCFSTPITGLPHEIASNPGVLFTEPCQRGSLGPPIKGSGKLIFQVFIGSKRGKLAVGRSRGSLEVNGESMTVNVTARSRSFLDMPKPEVINGRMVYNVDGTWMTFHDAAPHYRHTGYQLTYSFDLGCDPNQRYQLTISDITVDGREVAVPPVEFIPFTESFIRFD